MLLIISLLIQVALTLCCSCEERREYYTYTTTQPAYEYPEYQYNPYSPTGYCYKYEPYSQPSYEASVSTILYPYPVPVVYESPNEETPCGCKRKHTERTQCSERRYRDDDDDREYISSRCTCTCSERERIERRYETDRDIKPSCGCRKSEEYRRDDRYYDREEDFGRKVKCVCVYDEKADFRDEDDDWERRSSRREDQRCRHRENNRDCGCSRKNKQH